MVEVWKDVKGYEGLYKVSNTGKVMGKNKEIVQKKNSKGYLYCQLWKNNFPKTKRIHRLVAEAFILNPENKEEVNHKDANKVNNFVENLEWVTRQENMEHAKKNKLLKKHIWSEKEKFIYSMKKGSYIYQLDMHGNIVNVWQSANIAGEFLGISSSHISECCRKNGKRKSANGFKWRRVDTITREQIVQMMYNFFVKGGK